MSDQVLFVLSAKAYDVFKRLLKAPPPPNDELKKLLSTERAK